MSEDIILSTSGLTKEFAGFTAVNGVDLKVKRGSIHALIAQMVPARRRVSIC
ncbi:hypothetical protein BIWAKO_01423 [Bosea sp. BIWAKO-01]|nr:hypothetical protein BIWAKO_01423 [Bosea sp. BIWAKO-01]